LRDALLKTSEVIEYLGAAEISELFGARKHLGNSSAAIDRVLAAAKTAKPTSTRGSE